MHPEPARDFRYEDLRIFDAFERVSEPGVYTPLPDDWMVGVADVVNSTGALKGGRYKAVNMAGASVVAAVMNALGGAKFPFVFAGDGAVLAVPAEAGGRTRGAMAATANYVAAELGLGLRVGMVSVGAIRAAGHDMRVARYAASSEAIYAMFAGGGASYAEAELKAGRITLDPAPADRRPDLTGLSCRWSPLQARRGVILSILVVPAHGASPDAFRRIATGVIRMTEEVERGGNPVPVGGPQFALNLRGLNTEAGAARKRFGFRPMRLAKLLGEMLIGIALDRAGRPLHGFDPRRYRSWVPMNSDFRKFDDALRMTIDCAPEAADRIEAFLVEAEAGRIVDYGLHRQNAALMTCIVPSMFEDDHLHFLDGAGGGYALSARVMKERLATRGSAGAGLDA
ncbi:MAG: DUF3095 domain-containing protein [Rhizobiales bacterium]|nr:DUF3095 domain-containing protein [Hyphomicrobiales bacterium]